MDLRRKLVQISEDAYFQSFLILLFGIYFLYLGTGYKLIGYMGSHLAFFISGAYFGKAVQSILLKSTDKIGFSKKEKNEK